MLDTACLTAHPALFASLFPLDCMDFDLTILDSSIALQTALAWIICPILSGTNTSNSKNGWTPLITYMAF